MSNKVFHVVGNGDRAQLFNRSKREGKILTCNMPPFEIENVFATCMVDFKMMMALTEGSVRLDAYDWILGTRPRIWMEQRGAFYMKYAQNVKQFYTHVPDYAGNATNFNCGHMAVHYAASIQGADEIHMYGFDTIFDFNIRSVTDLFLMSDRDQQNNFRLINNWRPVWTNIFKEFPDTKFVLHHTHSNLKIEAGSNVEIVAYEAQPGKKNPPQIVEPDMSDWNRHSRRAYEAAQKKKK